MDQKFTKLQKIKSKLRSISSLNDEEIAYLSTLTHREKTEMIELFNNVFKYIIEYVEVTLKDL